MHYVRSGVELQSLEGVVTKRRKSMMFDELDVSKSYFLRHGVSHYIANKLLKLSEGGSSMIQERKGRDWLRL